MAYETFTGYMTALADAVRAKFGVTGSLTVAGMASAVSGQPYSSAGATLAGFDADMYVLGEAIRAKTGGSDSMTIPEMAAAVAGISLGYTSFTDPSLVNSLFVGSAYNRIALRLPAGTYSGLKFYGIRTRPSQIIFACTASGIATTGSVNASFTYSQTDHTVTITGAVPGGRTCLWFTDGYDDYVDVSPNANGSDGFAWSGNVTYAEDWQTPAFTTVLASDSCLCITFDEFTAALTLMAMRPSPDAVTQDEEAAYFAELARLKAGEV